MRTAQRQILHRGFGPTGSLNLALVGSFHLVTDGTGATCSGVRAKNPAAKSSTMKGSKGLGSKLLMETVPNREKPSFVGKGTLLVSCPRNHRLVPVETMACREAGAWSDGPEVVPPSNVTAEVKSSLIREGDLGPQVVLRCLAGALPLIGNEVFEIQIAGRVASVEAAVSEKRPRANLLQGSGKVVSAPGWHRALKNDERADG